MFFYNFRLKEIFFLFANTPEGAKVIAVENGTAEYATDLTQTDSYTYKLMLVNSSTYAPLCAAWSN